MAPTTNPEVEELKSRVHKLEARIAQLESGHGGSSSSTQESVRMILMGPPGAGELHTAC
jgi:adenylate kinase